MSSGKESATVNSGDRLYMYLNSKWSPQNLGIAISSVMLVRFKHNVHCPHNSQSQSRTRYGKLMPCNEFGPLFLDLLTSSQIIILFQIRAISHDTVQILNRAIIFYYFHLAYGGRKIVSPVTYTHPNLFWCLHANQLWVLVPSFYLTPYITRSNKIDTSQRLQEKFKILILNTELDLDLGASQQKQMAPRILRIKEKYKLEEFKKLVERIIWRRTWDAVDHESNENRIERQNHSSGIKSGRSCRPHFQNRLSVTKQ